MTGDPPVPDETIDFWDLFVRTKARLGELEGIAERMVATCADPIAVSDYWRWRAQE